MATRAFASYLFEELTPGAAVQGANELADYIRATSTHTYRACGTCQTGSDPMSGVDPQLPAHGIAGLPTIHSATSPQIPSGNLNAISMAIGEKGADMIEAVI